MTTDTPTFTTLLPEDVMKVLRSMPRDLREFIRDNNVWLAGGYIRAVIANETPNDVDLFRDGSGDTEGLPRFKCLAHDALAGKLGGIYGEGYTSTPNAYTIAARGRMPVQFITRWEFSKVEDLLASFDFTIAQAAIWFEGGAWRSASAAHFYAHLASKSLVYLAPDRKEDAGGSLLRVVRFLRKGYSISPEELSAVIARLIVGGGIRIPEILSNPLGDATKHDSAMVQRSVAAGIVLQLRLVDPLHINDGILDRQVQQYTTSGLGLVEDDGEAEFQ